MGQVFNLPSWDGQVENLPHDGADHSAQETVLAVGNRGQPERQHAAGDFVGDGDGLTAAIQFADDDVFELLVLFAEDEFTESLVNEMFRGGDLRVAFGFGRARELRCGA